MAENAGKRGQGTAFPNSEIQILTFFVSKPARFSVRNIKTY
jgi:hypothetical protein